MNSKKHVLIGKFGKTIKFENFDINTGGDAPIIFFSVISRMNPEWDFYFIGPNDLKKLTAEQYEFLFPNKNVYSAFSKGDDIDHKFDPIVQYFKDRDITPDFGIFFNGMVARANVPHFLKKADGNFYSPLICFENYAAPYINTLNVLGTPYYVLAEDPRYITVNAKDLCNRERFIFTQTNGEFTPPQFITSMTDWTLTTKKIKGIYSGIEKIFMMGLPEDWKERIDINKKLNSKGNKFIVLSNGHACDRINNPGSTGTRFNGYNEWIIENFKNTEYADTKIYGKWEDEFYDKYPQIQNKKLIDLMDEIGEAKYSFVYSIIPGFVTVKAWEMITIGLIPFLHPEYDKDNLLKLPEFVYCKTPQDLLDKVRYLDAHPDEYVKLLNECIERIRPSWISGSALNNFIFSKIAEDLGFTYEKKEGVKQIFNRFNKKTFS